MDADEIEENRPDDFISILVNQVYKFDWMMLVAVAISYILVVSDLYHKLVMNKFPKFTTQSGDLSVKGYMFQLTSILAGTIIFKVLFGFAGM